MCLVACVWLEGDCCTCCFPNNAPSHLFSQLTSLVLPHASSPVFCTLLQVDGQNVAVEVDGSHHYTNSLPHMPLSEVIVRRRMLQVRAVV